uniref:Importin N-terminal domain-containing protein n=1 Tax=Rhabditophanes sp. KR3021 TaxID=114890 RepID=A0AC35U918_9BILA
MERPRIIEALKATMNPDQQKEANAYLTEMEKMVGFSHLILQILMDETQELPTRQAASIFFKNFIYKGWAPDEDEVDKVFISEGDKATIRQHIVSCIVTAPVALRVQLLSSAHNILRTDFPDKWPEFVGQIESLLNSTSADNWAAALNLLYRLAKVFEYKRGKEKLPMVQMLSHVFPLITSRFSELINDQGDDSVFIQKLVLKIFYRVIQYSIPKDWQTTESLMHWLKMMLVIIDTALPGEVAAMDEDSQYCSVQWKLRKWATKIISRFYEKYGIIDMAEVEYEDIARGYAEHIDVAAVETLLKLCFRKTGGDYVSEQVIFYALTHLATAIGHSKTWKIIKPHLFDLTEKLLFPLMKHNEEDEDTWNDNPAEYIQIKYYCYEDFNNVGSAAVLIIQAAAKRKAILPSYLTFILNILSHSKDPIDTDGAIHMIGELAQYLVKNKKFKLEVEKLVETQLTCRLKDENRFLRSRACWCIKQFSDCIFNNKKYLEKVINGLVERLTTDPEIPVKVEAALAIVNYLENQPAAQALVRPRIRDVLTEVLRLVAKTEVEELSPVMEDLIETFHEDMIPIAYDITSELARLFSELVELNNGEAESDRTITIMGVLSTMITVVSLVEERDEIMRNIEPIVYQTVSAIFKSCASDFFEEAFTLVQCCIAKTVSPHMWEIFDDITGVVQTDAATFAEIMPVLHTYLKTSPEGFLAVPVRLQVLLKLCESVLEDVEYGEDNHLHAAKFLECIIVQCNPHVNHLLPSICQLALNRLQFPIAEAHQDLKPRLILVLIAAFYCNSELFIQFVRQLEPLKENTFEFLYTELLKNVKHIEGMHDRKMAILAFTMSLQLPASIRPTVINEHGGELTSVLIDLFDGLQKCIKAQDESDDEDEDDSVGDERDYDQELEDDDDEVDEYAVEYKENLMKRKAARAAKIVANGGVDPGSDYDSDDDDEGFETFVEETEVDGYVTSMDDDENLNVFTRFLDVFEGLQTTDGQFFAKMTTIEAAKREELQKLVALCGQKKQQDAAKKLEASGGFAFNPAASLPQTFNFGN